MLGLATNVLIRLLVRDDQEQYEKAIGLIQRESRKGEPVLISLLVLLEVEWVLRSRYAIPKAEILAVFSAMLESSDLAFEDEATVEQAIYSWKEAPADFADCMIGTHNSRMGRHATATFDEKALKLASFVSL